MEALGRLFNLASVVTPIDLASGAQTGKRIHLKDAGGVAFVYIAEAGTAGEDVDLDVQQHTASSGGTTADLDATGTAGTTGVTKFYSKRAATALDNSEAWVKSTQTEASEVDLGADEGESHIIAVVEVQASQLADGYEWVSCNTTDSGATAGKFGTILGIVYDLVVQRAPENLAALLT